VRKRSSPEPEDGTDASELNKRRTSGGSGPRTKQVASGKKKGGSAARVGVQSELSMDALDGPREEVTASGKAKPFRCSACPQTFSRSHGECCV
jgi:hypothetical protein